MKRATQRLAARHARQQVEAARRSDRASAAVSRAVLRHWRALLLALRRTRCPVTGHALARQALGILPRIAAAALADELRKTTLWCHRSACASIRGTLPHDRLCGVAQRKAQLRESVDYSDLFAPYRDDVNDADIASSPDFMSILFPTPDAARVEQVIHGSGWQHRLRSGTGLGDPASMAARVMTGILLGKDHREIARDLLPEVNRIHSTARRIARTESMRVVGAVQMDAHQQLGDLVVGYRVHATLDANTRPWHRERDGTVYYLDPGPGQKGPAQMPHPPDEAEDIRERPEGTPQTAWNCLLPGAAVQGRFSGAMKARYSGKAVELRTAGGSLLRVTANHPVLTVEGFVPAKSIRQGQQLLRHMGRVQHFADHEHDAPALVEDVFGAIKKFSRVVSRRPIIFDLHGDEQFVQGQVEVVLAQRRLLADAESQQPERVSDDVFRWGGRNTSEESRASARPLGGLGVLAPAPRLVGGSDLFQPLLFGHVEPLHEFRFGAASHLDAGRHERAGQAEGLSVGAPFSASGDARFVRELLQRFATLVTTDQVVEVRDLEYTGHVYDLHSAGGWIVANDIYISNCRCYLTPVLRD